MHPKLDQSSAAPIVGMFGKVPGCAEFVRHNMAGASGRKILEWLGPIWEQARSRPTYFSLHNGGPTVTYGHCQSSSDRLGRVAPLVQFVEAQSGSPPELLKLIRPYAGVQLERPEVRQRWACYLQYAWKVQGTRLGEYEQQRLRRLTTKEFLDEFEPGMCASTRDYAFATLWQASSRVIGCSETPFRLELPAHSKHIQSFWHYFFHQLLDLSPVSTKLLWWHDEGRSLTLQTGVTAPAHRLWRLKTSGEEARLRVSSTLPPAWRNLLNCQQSSAQAFADSMIRVFFNTKERVLVHG